ncbi:MAG: 30S ribosomal protein S20 [Patescibacteria group bacterium]|nr:30S ribosomal protein S20 [Patescibacteria group bacterium]
MPHKKSAKKRIGTSQKAQLQNRHYRTMMRTTIKKLRTTTDKESAELQYKKTSSILDRLVSKGIIHRNQAARKKSRLSKFIHSLA